jgi:hypothetical protein
MPILAFVGAVFGGVGHWGKRFLGLLFGVFGQE